LWSLAEPHIEGPAFRRRPTSALRAGEVGTRTCGSASRAPGRAHGHCLAWICTARLRPAARRPPEPLHLSRKFCRAATR